MNKAYIDSLSAFINKNYGIKINRMIPAERGWFGETWRIYSSDADYFVKIDCWEHHKELYKTSFAIMEYITQNGISHTSKIVKTVNNDLYTVWKDGILGIFEFVEGENTEDYPMENLFQKLMPIYKLPADDLLIDKETFGTEVINDLENKIRDLGSMDTDSSKHLIALLRSKSELTGCYKERLRTFSDRCRSDNTGFHITHGDAGGNCIINDDIFVITDWDHPMLAPIERDAWFYIGNREKIDVINKILVTNGIGYMLIIDRLCYYCYFSFLYYMTEHLQKYFNLVSECDRLPMAKMMDRYFDSWITVPLKAADKYL